MVPGVVIELTDEEADRLTDILLTHPYETEDEAFFGAQLIHYIHKAKITGFFKYPASKAKKEVPMS